MHSEGRGSNCGAGLNFNTLYMYRLCPDFLSLRHREVSLRAAGGGGHICHACLLPSLANGSPDVCQVPATSRDKPSPFARVPKTEFIRDYRLKPIKGAM